MLDSSTSSMTGVFYQDLRMIHNLAPVEAPIVDHRHMILEYPSTRTMYQ